MTDNYTEATTSYWQHIDDDAGAEVAIEGDGTDAAPVFRFGFPARLPDGRVLRLPIRALPNEPGRAVASLILNQASLAVAETLGHMLAQRLQPMDCDVLVGLPTLGMALVPSVAQALGHQRYVPLGYSRKFWYEESLSVPVQSITSPVPGKRLYLDPNQRALVEGRRVVIVDDAVSSGTTLQAAWDLLDAVGAQVVGAGVAMRQGTRWAALLGASRADRVVGVFDSPRLSAVAGGWVRSS